MSLLPVVFIVLFYDFNNMFQLRRLFYSYIYGPVNPIVSISIGKNVHFTAYMFFRICSGNSNRNF